MKSLLIHSESIGVAFLKAGDLFTKTPDSSEFFVVIRRLYDGVLCVKANSQALQEGLPNSDKVYPVEIV